jgi:predicted ATPase
MRGYVLACHGEAVAGQALARSGVADRTSTGSKWHGTFYLGLLAQSLEKAGQIEEALGSVATAIEMAHGMGERWFEAELHRHRGEWLIAYGRGQDSDAEACFRRAFELAQQQSARMWELRAATSLARLWRDRGKHVEARDLLAPVHAWFTEGFETPDLREAKALLGELGE